MKKIIDQINSLKRAKKAVVLAHNYQPAEIQDVADYVGDSLGLSIEATRHSDAEIIVFCGVLFMAETAAVLNPDRKILVPDPDAGCPMADMITGEQLREFKAKHPGAKVICYVNSTADVKAESDICCTSSNAVKVAESISEEHDILFVPDKLLGSFVAKRVNRNFIFWDGYCPIHEKLSASSVLEMKKMHPGVPVIVHPETGPEVQELADYILSTGQMLDLIKDNEAKKFLIGTEEGILHAMKKVAPEKEFILMSNCLLCPDMKKNNLEKLLHCLQTEETEITVPEEIAVRARKSIQAMLEIK